PFLFSLSLPAPCSTLLPYPPLFRSLKLYGAESAGALMARLSDVMRDETLDGLASEMQQLWENGKSFKSTSVNYTLDGRRMDIALDRKSTRLNSSHVKISSAVLCLQK